MFESCRTLPELKRAYHIAAKQSHPDMGGTDAAMQVVTAEYKRACALIGTLRGAPERPDYYDEGPEESIVWDQAIRREQDRIEHERQQAKARKERLAALRQRDPLMADLVEMERGSLLWECKLTEYCCREMLWPDEALQEVRAETIRVRDGWGYLSVAVREQRAA